MSPQRPLAVLLASSLTLLAGAARAEPAADAPRPDPPAAESARPEGDPRAPFAPAAGFALNGTLRFAPGGALVLTSPWSAPVMLGYRGARVALLAGPLLDRTATDHAGGATTSLGGALRGEITALRGAAGHVDLYVPIEATASAWISAPPVGDLPTVSFLSASGGLGLRYWATPHAGVFAESSVRFATSTNADVLTSTPNVSRRSTSESIVSAVGVALVL